MVTYIPLLKKEDNLGGNFTWTIPAEYYTQIPNNKRGEGSIICSTYSGEKLVGEEFCYFYVTTSEAKCKPIIQGNVIDINETTIALTGDANKLIQYRSTARVTMETTAKNSAYITNKTINNIPVSGNILEIINSPDTTFQLYAIDSREYPVIDELTPKIIPYIPLTINAEFKRVQPTKGEVSLTYSGKCFSGSFGTIDNNLEIKWYYREKNQEEWIEGGTIIPTINENKISVETITLGTNFDYQKAYNFKLVATDKLDTVTINSEVSIGQPTFCWGKDFFNINGNLMWFGKNLLSVIFPIGSTYITQEDINPKTILGFGTWERLKGKVFVGLDENDVDFNKIGNTGGSKEQELRALIGATHSDVNRLGYQFGAKIENQSYAYSVRGVVGDTVTNSIQPENINHTTIVLKSDGTKPSTVQPYEVVGYMWIRRS